MTYKRNSCTTLEGTSTTTPISNWNLCIMYSCVNYTPLQQEYSEFLSAILNEQTVTVWLGLKFELLYIIVWKQLHLTVKSQKISSLIYTIQYYVNQYSQLHVVVQVFSKDIHRY